MGWKDWFLFKRADSPKPPSFTETRVVQATTDVPQKTRPNAGESLPDTIRKVYWNRTAHLISRLETFVSTFDRTFGRRPGMEESLDDFIGRLKEHVANERAFHGSTYLDDALQFLEEIQMHGNAWECEPDHLAETLLAWVIADLESLERGISYLTSQHLSIDQWSALFRQLCLFYDALWYKILLPDRILKTGRVPSESIEAYRETVRQKSMELIAIAEYLPEEWRNWGTEAFSTDLRTDFEFYMEGIVPSARQEEFDMILNFTRARESGPVFEMVAWLHMRTREILGMTDKKADLVICATLWNSQANFTWELIEKAMFNIVPIAE